MQFLAEFRINVVSLPWGFQLHFPRICPFPAVRGNFLFPPAKIYNIYHIDNQFIVFFNLISRLPLIYVYYLWLFCVSQSPWLTDIVLRHKMVIPSHDMVISSHETTILGCKAFADATMVRRDSCVCCLKIAAFLMKNQSLFATNLPQHAKKHLKTGMKWCSFVQKTVIFVLMTVNLEMSATHFWRLIHLYIGK